MNKTDSDVLENLMVLDRKGLEAMKLDLYAGQLGVHVKPELVELALLQRRWMDQIANSVLCFFIGGIALVSGLLMQILPWAENGRSDVLIAGWCIVVAGAFALALGIYFRAEGNTTNSAADGMRAWYFES